MEKQVLFLHGGGEGGYEADTKLTDSLRNELGDAYEVHNPEIHFNDILPDFGWIAQIGKKISSIKDEIILVGHSFGASMILKYLSENRIRKKIDGLFLIAAPYWNGDEDWKQGIKLHRSFANRIPENIPIFLYQCEDDEVVPLDHLEFYIKNMPHATVRKITSGGHQFNNDMSLIAKDIKSL